MALQQLLCLVQIFQQLVVILFCGGTVFAAEDKDPSVIQLDFDTVFGIQIRYDVVFTPGFILPDTSPENVIIIGVGDPLAFRRELHQLGLCDRLLLHDLLLQLVLLHYPVRYCGDRQQPEEQRRLHPRLPPR